MVYENEKKVNKIIIFPLNQLQACKVMRVEQLNADKNMWVKKSDLRRNF